MCWIVISISFSLIQEESEEPELNGVDTSPVHYQPVKVSVIIESDVVFSFLRFADAFLVMSMVPPGGGHDSPHEFTGHPSATPLASTDCSSVSYAFDPKCTASQASQSCSSLTHRNPPAI